MCNVTIKLYYQSMERSTFHFTKFFVNIIADQAIGNQRNQIPMFIWNNKPHRSITPASSSLELCEPLAMLLIRRIESNQRSCVKFKSTHCLLAFDTAPKELVRMITANQVLRLNGIASVGNRVFNAQISMNGPANRIAAIKDPAKIICTNDFISVPTKVINGVWWRGEQSLFPALPPSS